MRRAAALLALFLAAAAAAAAQEEERPAAPAGVPIRLDGLKLVRSSNGGAAASRREASTTVREGTAVGRVVATITPSLVTATPSGTPVPLGVDVALEDALRNGEDLILDRKYDEALALFEGVNVTHPDSAVGPIGKILVYQSQMLENGDFSKDAEFEKEAKIAGARLEKALAKKGEEAWDHVLSAGYYGVRGLHAMRQKKYLKAVDDGWTALNAIKWLEKNEPELADADVGVGAYDYWRSVITKSVSWIPFFPDKRKSGIVSMEKGMVDAQLTRPIAQLVLIFVYIDERRYDDAITLAEDLATRYPANTLVRVQLGRAYSRKHRYSDAIAMYEEVLRLQPDNKVADYYLGANYLYQGKDLDKAEAHLRKFIENPAGKDWRGWAYERLGDVYLKRKKTEAAIVYWKKALRDNPDDKSVEKKIESARKRMAAATPVITPTPGAGPGTLP